MKSATNKELTSSVYNIGMTPPYLMFGRDVKTKLAELRPKKGVLDKLFRERDCNKLTGKFSIC